MPLQPKQQPPYYENLEQSKIYKALISQGGTDAPTVKIIKNTLGNIIWTYNAVGEYIGTLTGAFTTDKTYGEITQTSIDRHMVYADGGDQNTIYIMTYDMTGNPLNGILFNTPITITVN